MNKNLKRSKVAAVEEVENHGNRKGRCAIRVSLQGSRGKPNEEGEVERGFYSPEVQSDAAAELYNRLGIPYDAETSWDLKDIDRRASKDGSFENREGLQQHLEDAKNKKFTDIAFYKVSRMARSPADGIQIALDFCAAGVRVHFLRDQLPDVNSPVGQTFLFWFLAQARAESENTGQFISDTIAKKWKKGIPHGRVHGWLKKNTHGYEISEKGWTVYRRLVELGLEGHSYSEISRRLNREGVRTTGGCLWSAAQISNILGLENIPKLLGTAVCDDLLDDQGKPIRIENAWPALITEAEAAQLRLLAPLKTDSVPPVKNERKNYARNRFLLSGLIRCSICGEQLNAGHAHSRGVHTFQTYCCLQGANANPLHADEELRAKFLGTKMDNKTLQIDRENLDEAVLRVVTHGMETPAVDKALADHAPRRKVKIRTLTDVEKDGARLFQQQEQIPEWAFSNRMHQLDVERSSILEEMANEQSQRNLELALRREQDEATAKKLLVRAMVATATFPHQLQGKRRIYRAVRVVMKTGEAFLAPIHKKDFTGLRVVIRDDTPD